MSRSPDHSGAAKRLENHSQPMMDERGRHLVDVFIEFKLSFAAIAYLIEILETQGILSVP